MVKWWLYQTHWLEISGLDACYQNIISTITNNNLNISPLCVLMDALLEGVNTLSWEAATLALWGT